ncbi:hypothetical protein DB30_00294 [Enhygromyxa salina]|uniref:Uncharacterized protein n=1 Tax=Enhygromyxa salina TaxID=215803 RepID=A0A0C1ZM99_9BACT|nr:hypothetical protein DB30_00294 [Enhygromyxa salina]
MWRSEEQDDRQENVHVSPDHTRLSGARLRGRCWEQQISTRPRPRTVAPATVTKAAFARSIISLPSVACAQVREWARSTLAAHFPVSTTPRHPKLRANDRVIAPSRVIERKTRHLFTSGRCLSSIEVSTHLEIAEVEQ